jgi:hypothetical protein
MITIRGSSARPISGYWRAGSSMLQDTVLKVPVPGELANHYDPVGHTLTATLPTLSLN